MENTPNRYRNGREANLGDPVIGRCYGAKGIVTGRLLSFNPANVGYLASVWMAPNAKVSDVTQNSMDRIIGVYSKEETGLAEPLLILYRESFTQCDLLLRADDALADDEGDPNDPSLYETTWNPITFEPQLRMIKNTLNGHEQIEGLIHSLQSILASSREMRR